MDYINATRKINSNDSYEAKYYAQTAIQISNKFSDNLNISIKKLAVNLLNKIKNGENDTKSFTYFTLSELIVFSNKQSSSIKTKGRIQYKIFERNSNLKLTNKSCDMSCSPKTLYMMKIIFL